MTQTSSTGPWLSSHTPQLNSCAPQDEPKHSGVSVSRHTANTVVLPVEPATFRRGASIPSGFWRMDTNYYPQQLYSAFSDIWIVHYVAFSKAFNMNLLLCCFLLHWPVNVGWWDSSNQSGIFPVSICGAGRQGQSQLTLGGRGLQVIGVR